MEILSRVITKDELNVMAEATFGDMVKAVVDVEKELLAVDAELHADLEELLLSNGSKQASLWGINIYPEMEDEDFIEFDSLINIRPAQGNRGRGVYDPVIQQKIKEVVFKWTE